MRDRIKELRRVPASQLVPHPKNWRTHPENQRAALRGMLEQIGIADAVIAREDEAGNLHLIDGHLRTEELGDAEVPVLVLDVTEAEGDAILATLDPLAGLAGVDSGRLAELLGGVRLDPGDFRDSLEGLACLTPEHGPVEIPPSRYVQQYGVIVVCNTEADQRETYDRLHASGFNCKVVCT